MRGPWPRRAPLHSRDADFLQVALREGQEDAEVHVLLLEHLQVLPTPDLLQQRGEVLEGKGARAGQRTGGAPRCGTTKALLRRRALLTRVRVCQSPKFPSGRCCLSRSPPAPASAIGQSRVSRPPQPGPPSCCLGGGSSSNKLLVFVSLRLSELLLHL